MDDKLACQDCGIEADPKDAGLSTGAALGKIQKIVSFRRAGAEADTIALKVHWFHTLRKDPDIKGNYQVLVNPKETTYRCEFLLASQVVSQVAFCKDPSFPAVLHTLSYR